MAADLTARDGTDLSHRPSPNLRLQPKSIPQKVVLLPNKLSKEVRNYPFFKERRAFNPNNIRFASVGGVRYNSLLSLAKHICRNFPNHEFHFYGYVSQTINENELPKGKNIYYHVYVMEYL